MRPIQADFEGVVSSRGRTRSSQARVAATYQSRMRSRSSSSFSAWRAAPAFGGDTQNRAIESVGLTVDHRAVRRHDAGHGVDGNDDRPFEALGGVHREERDGLFLIWLGCRVRIGN